MTRFALIAWAPAVLEQSAIHGNARWIGNSAALLAIRHETENANRSGFAAGRQAGCGSRWPRQVIARDENGCLGDVDGEAVGSADRPGK